MWLLYAQFEIRELELVNARKALVSKTWENFSIVQVWMVLKSLALLSHWLIKPTSRGVLYFYFDIPSADQGAYLVVLSYV